MLAGFQTPPDTAGRGNVYVAYATETAPAIWTATALGGPILYNNSGSAFAGTGRGVTAYILAISFGLTTAATAAAALGLCFGASTALASTTAITSVGNLRLIPSAPAPQCTAYAAGTVSAAATFFWPMGQVGTSALTAEIADDNLIPLGGAIEVSPGYFAAVACSAALSTAVLQMAIVWMELPRD